MDIQKRKSQSRKEYEAAVFVLKTVDENKCYGKMIHSKARQIDMLHNCMGRIGLTNEQIQKLSIVHITGTKGKGSTCIYIEGILRKYGYKTGFFSSPHVVEMRDRVMINGWPVEDALFTSAFWHVYTTLHLSLAKHGGLMPGFFVFSLLMALHLFIQQEVDVVLMEVGMGGEYDATNFIQRPVVCGVTSLHVEHTNILGNTIEEIAWHKAGIMKSGVPLVTVAHQDSVMAVLRDRALHKQCPLYIAVPMSEEELGGSAPGIAGNIQALNASLAIQIARLWRQRTENGVGCCDENGIDHEGDILGVMKLSIDLTLEEREGVLLARLPGRCQVIKRSGVTYYLDGAHTTDSMQNCVTWFNDTARQEAVQLGCKIFRTLVFRLKKDKPMKAILPYLMKSGFHRTAFTPYVISISDRMCVADALDLAEDPETARQTSLSQLELWNQLQEEEEDILLRSDACSSLCFPSIVSALWWASLAQDTTLQRMAVEDLSLHASNQDQEGPDPQLPCCNGAGPGTGDKVHVQVLVTGSLALVGGALTLLQPEF